MEPQHQTPDAEHKESSLPESLIYCQQPHVTQSTQKKAHQRIQSPTDVFILKWQSVARAQHKREGEKQGEEINECGERKRQQ